MGRGEGGERVGEKPCFSSIPTLFVSKSIASISFSQKWLNKVVALVQ